MTNVAQQTQKRLDHPAWAHTFSANQQELPTQPIITKDHQWLHPQRAARPRFVMAAMVVIAAIVTTPLAALAAANTNIAKELIAVFTGIALLAAIRGTYQCWPQNRSHAVVPLAMTALIASTIFATAMFVATMA